VERGGGEKNLPRQIAMYLSKQYTDVKLSEIAGYFKVGHYLTVSQAVHRLKEKLQHDCPLMNGTLMALFNLYTIALVRAIYRKFMVWDLSGQDHLNMNKIK
jgi:hypothetical protein